MDSLRRTSMIVAIASLLASAPVVAQPAGEPVPAPAPVPDPALAPVEPVPVPAALPLPAAPVLRRIQVHGFVSQGAFISTANDYIGASERGTLKMTEVGLNVSTEVTDRLRAGVQLFSREVGIYEDLAPRIDWAFLDYTYKRWLGLRAGVIKMPFGLYNEYSDIDSARTTLLLPQGLYPLRNREALLAHRGFALYGEVPISSAGSLEYQTWLGTLAVPANALNLTGGTLQSSDTKYVTGAQVFWHPPVEGLRFGGTYLRTSIDFNVTLSPENTAAVIMAGLAPPTYDGALVISLRPITAFVGSVEYQHGAWQFAAEYGRAFTRQVSTLSAVSPEIHRNTEGIYAMVGYQATPRVATSLYYSLDHLDANDRRGRDGKRDGTYPEAFYAFQRDLAASLRFDVNEHWLWKAEAHFMDGTADIQAAANPERYWGLFLVKTTVTF